MTKDERSKIYSLLSKFYPSAKQLKDQAALTAYGLVLEKYTYEDVKAAVIEYASKSRYFPHISELVKNIRPLYSGCAQRATKEDLARMRRFIDKMNSEER